MSARSFSSRLLALTTLLGAFAAPALADKLVVTGPGFTFSGPCSAVERPIYLSCERFCEEINKVPGYTCKYSEGRVVMTGGPLAWGTTTEEATQLDIEPFTVIDLDVEASDDTGLEGAAPTSWQLRTGEGIEVIVRGADGVESSWMGPVELTIPAEAGAHVQIISHSPFRETVSVQAQ